MRHVRCYRRVSQPTCAAASHRSHAWLAPAKFHCSIVCWGDNTHGALSVPDGFSSPALLAGGAMSTCAIDANDVVTCWGNRNPWNQAARTATATRTATPTQS